MSRDIRNWVTPFILKLLLQFCMTLNEPGSLITISGAFQKKGFCWRPLARPWCPMFQPEKKINQKTVMVMSLPGSKSIQFLMSLPTWRGISRYFYNAATKITNECLYSPQEGLFVFSHYSMVSLLTWRGILRYFYNAVTKISNECLYSPQEGSTPLEVSRDALLSWLPFPGE